jgi:hypothetical protein
MKDALGVANYFVPTAHDAGSMPGGMASEKGNFIISRTEDGEVVTLQRIPAGAVENVTADGTPARNSPLSDENAIFVARIKRQVQRKEMSSIAERDKLVEIIEGLARD